MSLEIPCKEQMLYSQLAIIESLLDYLLDNLSNTEFDEDAIHEYLSTSRDRIVRVQKIMKNILVMH